MYSILINEFFIERYEIILANICAALQSKCRILWLLNTSSIGTTHEHPNPDLRSVSSVLPRNIWLMFYRRDNCRRSFGQGVWGSGKHVRYGCGPIHQGQDRFCSQVIVRTQSIGENIWVALHGVRIESFFWSILCFIVDMYRLWKVWRRHSIAALWVELAYT